MPNNVNNVNTIYTESNKHNRADIQTKSNKVLLMKDCLWRLCR